MTLQVGSACRGASSQAKGLKHRAGVVGRVSGELLQLPPPLWASVSPRYKEGVGLQVFFQTFWTGLHSRNRNFTIFIILKCFRFCSFIFRERKREGEKEGEKHQGVVASHMSPTGNPARIPGTCPDWELNWQPFGLQAGAQSTELHQPGLKFYIVTEKYINCFECCSLPAALFHNLGLGISHRLDCAAQIWAASEVLGTLPLLE